MAFDVALVKSLTGGDIITARRLFENSFEFKPQFTIFINTNYLPKVVDDTLFTSNRVNVITFDKHFSTTEQDPALKQKLITQTNISGIFNWLLEGLALYRKEGLKLPFSVIAATREYAVSSDKLQLFLDDCLEPETDGAVTAKETYN
jgi:putative DNA primase/helicase